MCQELKPSELARIASLNKVTLSRHLYKSQDKTKIINKRIRGVYPELAEEILKSKYPNISKTTIMLLSCTTGGVAKTSSTISLAFAARRIISRKTAIVLLDCDSQSTLSLLLSKEDAKNETLVDYVEGKASLDKILSPLNTEDNIYIIKSSLNNIYLDKALNKPSIIKIAMKKLFTEIIEKFGEGVKIFIDFPPQLSAIYSSTVLAMAQIENANKILATPLRADPQGIRGAEITVTETKDILNTFNYPESSLDITCFFSSLDRRVKSTTEIFKSVLSNKILSQYLSPVVIRYSSEITKSSLKNENIFTDSSSTSNISEDFTDLYLNLIAERT